MTTITQTKAKAPPAAPTFDVDIGLWLKTTIFDSLWKTIFFVALAVLTVIIVRGGYTADPVKLSFDFAPNGVPTSAGSLILTLTNGALLTTVLVGLWAVGAGWVAYSAARHHWPGPTPWLKESLYSGPFGALSTLALLIILVFAVRGLLSWALFGAEFRTDADSITLLRPLTPGAIWGVVSVNSRLFAIGQYPTDVLWRIYASLGLILLLAILSVLVWSFGSSLKKYRKPLVWAWLASMVIIFLLLRGQPGATSGPFRVVGTNFWGGFLLTIVLSVVGIVVSFPIGVLLALGRRSQVRGVPYMWLWGIIGLLIYWAFGNFPAQPVTFNVPVLFRNPPIWVVTLPPIGYAVAQAVVLVGLFWIIGYYLQGNLIKTFCIAYIEMIRGVPLITVLFMANIMLPIFLPRNVTVDNLLRVVIGIIMFSAAYQAENVRGGLQAVSKGQYEAAMSIGLSTAQSMRLIILPQALRAVIPAIVGLFIGLFKDTSLVAIVGLIDLLRVAQIVVAQPQWLGLHKETFAFVALVYWVFAFAMSQASQRLERKLGVGQY
jgi:general L-amino acid transport system permease protein